MLTTPPRVEVRNETRGTVVCAGARMADTFPLRLFGLLRERSLDEQDGLMIVPSSGVHTFGMSFPIDIVALDKHSRVVGLWPHIGPWKVRGLSLRTQRVLELAPGRIERCGLRVGDSLTVVACES